MLKAAELRLAAGCAAAAAAAAVSEAAFSSSASQRKVEIDSQIGQHRAKFVDPSYSMGDLRSTFGLMRGVQMKFFLLLLLPFFLVFLCG